MAERAREDDQPATGLSRKLSHWLPEVCNRREALKTAVGGAAAFCCGAKAKADLAVGSLSQVPARMTTGASVFKSRAVEDYRINTQPFGGQMSSPISRLLGCQLAGYPWQFEVAIIGSGYGASICAARLASRLRPGRRLCILERGREWVPGTFPDTLNDVLDQSRLRLMGRRKGEIYNPIGLFNIHQSDEISVLSGSGLGGSSLINASVALRPDVDVFEQPQWPAVLRSRAFLDPYYDRAEWELAVVREPHDHTDKMKAQRLAAERLRDCGAHYEAAAISVTRGYGSDALPIINRQGIRQRACIDCGDCLTGCNVGAKNTLAMNYLPMARRCGAEMFTQTEIRQIEKCNGYYRLHFLHHAADDTGEMRSMHGAVTARIVILGAGSLGSTEILLRSQSSGLCLSPSLGCNWTGNGDALGFVRKSQCRTGIRGIGAYPTNESRVGPTIQTNINYPLRPQLKHRALIQEGAAPRAYVTAMSALMLDFDLDQTQILLGMGHDGSEGRITLDEQGSPKISWPGLTESEYRKLIRAEFQKLASAQGGEYKFLKIFGDQMISVHPLGGCNMSDDPRRGVVDHRCQVFDATYGGDIDQSTAMPRVHDGLYVCDGASLPTSIACNPFLTISAIAERTAELIAMEPSYADLFI